MFLQFMIRVHFGIVNFPFMCSNIPAGPAYGIYISQLVRIGRICDNYEDFVSRNRLVTTRLINRAFVTLNYVAALKSLVGDIIIFFINTVNA